jgi:predicted nucleic acid-binding protein
MLESDPGMFVWWAAQVECISALSRRERELRLDPAEMRHALRRLGQLSEQWNEIEPSNALRETAVRLLRVHPLRAADALQLAAAFVASGGRPSALAIVTLDDRLADAARKEGFAIVDPRTED